MNNYLFLKLLLVISGLISFSGCSHEINQNNTIVNFASVSETEWNVVSKNLYQLSSSMRKIDSLSANLNLSFTKKNSLGL